MPPIGLRTTPRSALALLLGGASLLGAQQWVPPRPPCDISPGYFRIVSAQLDLKLAAERQDVRDRMLAQAKDVLFRSIVDDKQDKNPAAWYYLGRYFKAVGDAAGADTAFARAEALAPQCTADIATYRRVLSVETQNRAATAWQAGNQDSAAALFRLAYRLVPSNARPLFALAGLYAEAQTFDSAIVYYRRAAAAAAGDTTLSANRRDALSNVARIYLSRAQTDPAVQRAQQTRASQDSLERLLAADSAVVARMVASSVSRHKRQARLSPADQAAFSRDSSARADAVGRERAARAALAVQAASGAAAVRAVSAPAIAAHRDLLAAFPDDMDAATNLATLYAQSGEPDLATTVFDSVLAHAHNLQAEDLIIAGERLLGTGLVRPGARALSLGLARNPYRRDALFYLARAYYTLRDSANMLPTAQRLIALDPLNRNGIRLVAAAWDLKGRRDSTLKYVTRADSTLPVDITVSSFAPDSAGFVLTAVATNLRSAASQPFKLSFDFLGPGGAVATTLPADIPALPPGGSQQFELHVKGTDLLGWRYRPS